MVYLSNFKHAGIDWVVKFVETQIVKPGVDCDIYSITDDTTKDLTIVRVKKGFSTPKQLIIKGSKTIEGYISGKAFLSVTTASAKKIGYSFPNTEWTYVELGVGATMQWHSIEDLTFYEICEPPYEAGRFKDLD